MYLLFYILGIFLSLFILYAVSRHDFVLLRQSISLRQVYDNVFISLFVFFVLSRIAFSFYIESLQILNPLRFFYLTKYWGIVPYIGFAGMILALLLLFKKKKNKLRIIDIYLMSFSPIILLEILLQSNNGVFLVIKIIATLVLLGFYGWFIKIHNKYTTKDGFITFLTIITYSLVNLAFSFASYGIFSQKFLWYNAILTLSTIVSFIFLFLVQRDTFNKQ